MLVLTLSCPAGLTTWSEPVWRAHAAQHARRIHTLLEPGFVRAHQRHGGTISFEALNEKHPVFNFLQRYYHIQGLSGVRSLARWSPPLSADGGPVRLAGATADDLSSGVLHMRGATMLPGSGVEYDPRAAFATSERRASLPYSWYRSVLQRVEVAEPNLHCYGLHEWAMQYWPDGAEPPPSASYQQESMPLRVDRRVLNEAVELHGVRCTHVDALRFFAPAARAHNAHGAPLPREAQLDLEQPGCVHAQMDLLKMALRLSPWLHADVLAGCAEVAVHARTLDVAASPYDASAWGLAPIAVETAEGRAAYASEQEALMRRAAPVRRRLREAYDAFLSAAFGIGPLGSDGADTSGAEGAAGMYVQSDSAPAGREQPWRRNMLCGTEKV